MTAQAPQGGFRYDGGQRVPGGLQQPPAGRTGHVTDLRELGLPARPYNALHADGITTVEQAAALSDIQLSRILGLGRLGRSQIRDAIERWQHANPQPDPRPIELAALLRQAADLVDDLANRDVWPPWQPISDAPRDGTTVFATNWKLGQRGMVSFNGRQWAMVDGLTNRPMGIGLSPTHWLPLPPQPNGA